MAGCVGGIHVTHGAGIRKEAWPLYRRISGANLKNLKLAWLGVWVEYMSPVEQDSGRGPTSYMRECTTYISRQTVFQQR